MTLTADKALTLIPSVRLMARHYYSPRIEVEDLVQEGIVGLLEAVDKFDPTRSTDWKTYCLYRARSRMALFRWKNATPVNLPNYRYRYAWLYSGIEKLLDSANLDPRTREAILTDSDHPLTELPPKIAAAVRRAKENLTRQAKGFGTADYERAIQMVREDRWLMGEDTDEPLPDPEDTPALTDPESFVQAKQVLEHLDPLQQQIVLGRALGLTYEEIGEALEAVGWLPHRSGRWTKQNLYLHHERAKKRLKMLREERGK